MGFSHGSVQFNYGAWSRYKLNESSTCALCKQKSTLRESHIIPNFVGKWLKESGTGFLVSAQDGSKRVQDITKTYLLCDDCEKKFSKFERYFANKIFHPFHKQQIRMFEYDKNLELFIISLSWRVLKMTCENFKLRNPHLGLFIDKAEIHWREFLIGNRQTINPYENHLVFLDYAKNGTRIPPKFNWYALRAVDYTIVSYDKNRILVYVKLPWMIFVSTINPTILDDWYGTKINEKGKTNRTQSIKDGAFGQFLLDRASNALSASPGPTYEVGQNRLQRVMRKDPQKFLKSGTLETMIAEGDLLREQKMKDKPRSVIAIIKNIIEPSIWNPRMSKAVNQEHRLRSRKVADIISNLSKEESLKLDTKISSIIEKHKNLQKSVQTTFKTNTLWITFMIDQEVTKKYQQSKIIKEIENLRNEQIDVKVPIAVFSWNVENGGGSCESGYYL